MYTHIHLLSSLSLSIHPPIAICHLCQSPTITTSFFKSSSSSFLSVTLSFTVFTASLTLSLSPLFLHSLNSLTLCLQLNAWVKEKKGLRQRRVLQRARKVIHWVISLLGTLNWYCVVPVLFFRGASIHHDRILRDACCTTQDYCIMWNDCCKFFHWTVISHFLLIPKMVNAAEDQDCAGNRADELVAWRIIMLEAKSG